MTTTHPYQRARGEIYEWESGKATHEQIKAFIDRLPAGDAFSYEDASRHLGVYDNWHVLNSLDHWVEAGLLIETSPAECIGQERTWRKPATERLRGLSL